MARRHGLDWPLINASSLLSASAELLVFPITVAVTIHCAYPRRDGQVELTWVAGYIVRRFTNSKAVSHPTTNRAQCRAISSIQTNALPLYAKAPQSLLHAMRMHLDTIRDCDTYLCDTMQIVSDRRMDRSIPRMHASIACWRAIKTHWYPRF